MYIEAVKKARKQYIKVMGKAPYSIKMSQKFYDALVKEIEESGQTVISESTYKKDSIFGMTIEIDRQWEEYQFPNISTAFYEGGDNMKGYYEGYSYVGFMPNGKKMRFATEREYVEAWREWRQALSFFI